VVGPRAAVLVPAEESARVPGLWELAQGEPALSELLDTFLRDGLGRLPSFALATWGGDGIDVVLRGPVRVEAGGEAFDGAGISTWVERRFAAGGALSLRAAEAGDGAPLTVVAGVVLAGSLVIDAGVPAAAAPAVPPAPVEAVPAVDPGDAGDDPVADGPGEASSTPPVAAAGGALSAGGLAEAFAGGYDVVVPPSSSSVVTRLEFSHGETIDLDRTVIAGRAPEARRSQSGEQPRLVVVRSPQLEVSGTHLEIRPDKDGAVATDLNSTNGTLLTRPDTEPVPLTPGEPTVVGPGCVLDLGDGVTVTVTEVGERRGHLGAAPLLPH
jgi:hypothetical protein